MNTRENREITSQLIFTKGKLNKDRKIGMERGKKDSYVWRKGLRK